MLLFFCVYCHVQVVPIYFFQVCVEHNHSAFKHILSFLFSQLDLSASCTDLAMPFIRSPLQCYFINRRKPSNTSQMIIHFFSVITFVTKTGFSFRLDSFLPLVDLYLKVNGQLQTVTAERDAATREVAELRRQVAQNADEQPTQAAIEAFQVCMGFCLLLQREPAKFVINPPIAPVESLCCILIDLQLVGFVSFQQFFFLPVYILQGWPDS